jgi:hypothetical protein
MEKPSNCELCGRSDTTLNFHHLIPKFVHKKGKFKREYDKDFMNEHGAWICKYHCHKNIHRFFTEIELAEKFNTLELLKNTELIKNYLKWHLKQSKVK